MSKSDPIKFEFISTICIIQWHEIVDNYLLIKKKRASKLQTKTNIHTTWNQIHHLDTTCCSYLSDKILFIIYSSPSVMRFVSKVLNFYSVRQMYDKYVIYYMQNDNNTDSFLGEGSKLLCY